jgi:hypothetical protein
MLTATTLLKESQGLAEKIAWMMLMSVLTRLEKLNVEKKLVPTLSVVSVVVALKDSRMLLVNVSMLMNVLLEPISAVIILNVLIKKVVIVVNVSMGTQLIQKMQTGVSILMNVRKKIYAAV